MGEVKDWYESRYGEEKSIPEEWSWNGFFSYLLSSEAQECVLDARTQGRCIRELSRILRTNEDELRMKIGR